MSSPHIRAFVGLAIPEAVSFPLAEVAAKMSALDRGVLSWVPEDNYHLTLLFLGEQTEEWLEMLAEQMSDDVALLSQQLITQQVMPFPESSPKLLAAIVEDTPELSKMYQQVKKAAINCGFVPEKKRFRPHITLARKYPRKGHQLIPGAMEQLAANATQLIIYESHLAPAGATYRPLYEFDLI